MDGTIPPYRMITMPLWKLVMIVSLIFLLGITIACMYFRSTSQISLRNDNSSVKQPIPTKRIESIQPNPNGLGAFSCEDINSDMHSCDLYYAYHNYKDEFNIMRNEKFIENIDLDDKITYFSSNGSHLFIRILGGGDSIADYIAKSQPPFETTNIILIKDRNAETMVFTEPVGWIDQNQFLYKQIQGDLPDTYWLIDVNHPKERKPVKVN